MSQRFLRGWTAVLAVATALVTLHPEFETDPFWLMTTARAVLAHKSRVVPEPVALAAFSDPAVVPEWLWGTILLGLNRLGPVATATFVMLVAGAACAALVAMLVELRPSISRGTLAAISGGVAAVLLLRLRTRPEAAGLVLLPVFVILSRRFVAATSWKRGAALVALEVLWAQLHGSFVLAPLTFALLSVDAVRSPLTRRATLLAFVALVLGLTTSAFGIHVGDYVFGHASGDAGRHIVDWAPLRFEDFAPRDWLAGPYGGPYGAVCAVLLISSVCGMAAARRIFWQELALAAFGVALMATGCRFLSIGCLLAGPLAAAGLDEIINLIPSAQPLWVVGAAFGLAMVGLQGRDMDLARGPIGRVGLAEGDFPSSAAAYLQRAATEGERTPINVISSYDAGGPLAFWLPGLVRTYVDGRTPLTFDNTDYGVSRDVLAHPSAMDEAIARYDAGAVVITRDAGACPGLAVTWAAVSIEPRFTTFVPRDRAGKAALTAVAPCGPRFLRDDVCGDSGQALDDDLAKLTALHPSAFVRLLSTERILRCGGDLGVAASLLPSRDDARAFEGDRDRAEAALDVKTGRPAAAIDVLADAIRGGDPAALALALPTLTSDTFPVARARELLGAAVDRLDDKAPPDLRALLAVTCAEQRDMECARFNATRAAVGHSKLAIPTLLWLAREHPSARVRADAEAWLAIVKR